MKFTDQQLAAIKCTENCAVSAGAGSGKTKVLSERFLRLVHEGTPCNRILTITFTKKATSEMKERIHSLLVEHNDAQQLKLFSDAAISTVDSFCFEIARMGCRKYGYSSNLGIADEVWLKKEVQFLAGRYLEQTAKSVLKQLAEVKSIEDIKLMLVDCALESNVVYGFNAAEYAGKYLQEAENNAQKLKNLAEETADRYLRLLSSDSKLEENINTLKKFREGEIALGAITFNASKGTGAENQALAKELKDTIKQCMQSYVLYENTLKNRSFVQDVYKFVQGFVESVLSYKRRTGQADFNDIMQMALDILKTDQSVRNYFKNRFDYVMIDEFQDNNSDHRDLLYLLCERKDMCNPGVPLAKNLEKGKFFLVGDDKQSIYRFRGADVSVFNRICMELLENGGKVLELGTNFRSTPELVSHFSSLFERVMKDSSEEYEAKFRRLEHNPDGNFKAKSRIVYHNWHKPEDFEADDNLADKTQSEAYSIAKLINEMVNTDKWLINTKEGNPRRPDYKDIAILLRTSGHQGAFEKALRLNGIPYTLTETKSVMTEALVNDFYSILTLAIYPHDPVSKAAVLKSPLFNVKDSELPEKMAFELDEISEIPLNSITGALQYIWYDMGYRLFIISNPSNQVYSEHYDWLYALACSFDSLGKTVVQFLDYLRPFIGTSDKLKEVNTFTEESDGVQIMTIHKSKGLEFPVVIVASMETKSQPDKKSEITCFDNMIYLPLSEDCNGKYVNMKTVTEIDIEEKKELAELKRLFYVASTRAECHLVYSAAISSELDFDSPKTMTELLEKAGIQDELETITFDLIEEEKTFSTQRLDVQRIADVASYYSSSEAEDFDYSSETHSVTENETYSESDILSKDKLPSYDWDSEITENGLQTDFGTLVHSFIQNSIQSKKIHVETTLEKAAEYLSKKFFESSMFERIKGMKLYSERAFESNNGNGVTEGVIDLLAVDENRTVIFDFKTDKYKNPEIHRSQLEEYSKAVKKIYPDKKTEAWIIYLRDPESSVQML